ncbi:MAG: hypothetical protein Crog4KO_25050 [Crocinitomicaceae bacterium]
MTGPMLQGVKQKWEDAGEGELLYEWVKNSSELIATGKSSMASAIKNFSPTTMAPQQVSNEEVDAILTYVDAWEPSAPKVDEKDSKSAEVITVTDYDSNLNLFYALMTLTIFLLIAIIVMSGTVTRLINSEFFKKKIRENSKSLKTILTIGMFLGLGSSAFAFEFNGPGMAEEGEPWILIENIDLYVLLIIDIVLVGVIFYIRRMFNTFLAMTKEPKDAPAVEAEEDVIQKVNQILTDVVPIEEEHTILMDHEYDGIRELDNNLPPWWVWMFYGTIGFAIFYLFHYHVLGTGDLQITEYDKEMKQAKIEVEAYRKKMAMNVTADNATIMTEASDIKAGKAIFKQNCVQCHNPDGEGMNGSGPNLTDKYWIYGFEIKDVFATVDKGRPGGMPEHGTKLNPIQIQQVSSFVLQMPEKEGVAPKGSFVETAEDDVRTPDDADGDATENGEE